MSQAAEVQRAEERKRGAEVLAQQIEERSKERIKQEELINQERTQMVKVSPCNPLHCILTELYHRRKNLSPQVLAICH